MSADNYDNHLAITDVVAKGKVGPFNWDDDDDVIDDDNDYNYYYYYYYHHHDHEHYHYHYFKFFFNRPIFAQLLQAGLIPLRIAGARLLTGHMPLLFVKNKH